MKKIKKNIARTFTFVGKLLTFSLLFIASFGVCCLLGSWTIDINDNLVSDNLVKDDLSNLNIHSNSSSFSINDDNILIVINRANDNSSGVYFVLNSLLSSNETYSLTCLISSDVSINYLKYSMDNNTKVVAVNNTSYYLQDTFVFTQHAYVLYFDTSQIAHISISKIMLNVGDTPLDWEPYGVWYSSENYDNLQENYNNLVENYDTLQDDFDTLNNQYQSLQDEYDSLESQANEWYLEKRHLEEAYNQLANTIDFSIYSIDLVHYNSSDTLFDNYNVIHTISDISSLVVSNSYLDINALKRYALNNVASSLTQINGFIIKSSVDLSIANYNMLFNASSSPDYYLGLYYSNSTSDNLFVSYPLRVFNQSSDAFEYYLDGYSLYDVLHTQNFNDLFSDFTYNKIAFHLTTSNTDILNFYIRNIKLNSENGYNTGYSKGLLDSANTIASLQNNVDSLEKQKQTLNDRIDYLQSKIDDNLGWHSLFFSMADTPIKVVSGFLDYEILGINLFHALLGILTALAVLWLIKKFTK